MKLALRTTSFLAAVALTVIGLSACASTATRGVEAQATVHMTEFSYTPQTLTVPPNAKVKVQNDGKVVHNWIIKGMGVGTADVQPGASQTLNLAGIPQGTYAVYCDQPGHSAAGQTGTLVIRGS